MIRGIAQEQQLDMKTWSNDWIIEVAHQHLRHRIVGYRFGLNDAAAAALAQDKVATSLLLQDAHIPTVPHWLFRSDSPDPQSLTSGPIVLKPLSGTGGHGVQRCETIEHARRIIESSGCDDWAVSPYISIDREIRVVVLDDTVLLCYEKLPASRSELTMFNLGLGATPRDITPPASLVELAHQAQHTLGLRLAAIDICIDSKGTVQVLEVNDAIMTEHYARHSPDYEQHALAVYRAIVHALFH